jgi:addiction module RelB/DinJ family antitoxin
MADIHVVLDDDLYRDSKNVLEIMGLSIAGGVRLFLNYLVVEQKMPFVPTAGEKIPSVKTQKAMIDQVAETSWSEICEMAGEEE